MEKPLVLRKQEFKNALFAAVNQSKLPAYMLVDILRTLLAELDQQERQEIIRATKAWEKDQDHGEGET